jgi:hypothetical protein
VHIVRAVEAHRVYTFEYYMLFYHSILLRVFFVYTAKIRIL